MNKILLLLILIAIANVSEARVFSMGKESFAAYLLLSSGNSAIKDQAFVNESTATAYSGEVKLNTGGEFGFSYITGRAGWRFGFEILKPSVLTGVSATLGGTEIYQLKSDITCYAPKLGIELIVYQSQAMRLALLGYAGTASLTMKNDYSNLTISPNADFSLESKSSANMAGGGFVTEYYMMDTTTLLFELGYRDLKFKDITYSKSVTTGFNGAITAGDPVVDNTGTKREINFSGSYLSLGIRIWLK